MRIEQTAENFKNELSHVNVQTGAMLINSNFNGVVRLFEEICGDFLSGKVKR
jgi:hypothetical protein